MCRCCRIIGFFENAFGLSRRFLHESGALGELDTGETILSFANPDMGDMNFPGWHVAAHESAKLLGFEIALVTKDVKRPCQTVNYGATERAIPKERLWGRVVSSVRCPDGILVELCTPPCFLRASAVNGQFTHSDTRTMSSVVLGDIAPACLVECYPLWQLRFVRHEAVPSFA